MPVRFYTDEHVHQGLVEQLRRRGVDVLTVREDGWDESPDEDVLERARELGRMVFTQDVRFKARAESWLRSGRPFAGLAFAHQLDATIGELVRDLELIAGASEPEERLNVVQYLPFR